jgi:hypothetical protein
MRVGLQRTDSGFRFDPQLASRDDFWLTTAAISLKKGGGGTNTHWPLSEFKNIDIERSYGHFGPIHILIHLNKYLEVLILDTGFRHLLALNGHKFGINAHLAAHPTPRHRLKGPKPEGGMI